MARRRTASLDDDGDIAGGKLGCPERADDLEARWIAQTHEDPASLAIGARRQELRRCGRDRTRILDLMRSYVSISDGSVGEGNPIRRQRLPNSTIVEMALPSCNRQHAAYDSPGWTWMATGLIRKVCIASAHLAHPANPAANASTVSFVDGDWAYCRAAIALAEHEWAVVGAGLSVPDAARYAVQHSKPA